MARRDESANRDPQPSRWYVRISRALSSDAVIPELRRGHESVHRLAIGLRAVMLLLLGSAMLAFAHQPMRPVILVGAVLVYLGIPVTWWMWQRVGVIPPLFLLRDVVSLAVIASFEREIRPLCMFASIAVLAYICVSLRRPTALAFTAVSSIGMVVATIIGRDGNWGSSALSYPIAAFAVALPATAVARSLSRAWAANESIMRELGVALFEIPKGSTTASYVHGDLFAERGYTAEHFTVPGNWEALLHPDDREAAEKIDEDILAGLPYRFRFRQRNGAGEYVWIEEIGTPIHNQRGELLGVRGISFGVNERVRTDEAINRLNRLVENLPVAVTVVRLADPSDPTSLTYVYNNPAALAFGDGQDLSGLRMIDTLPAAFDTTSHRGLGYAIARAITEGKPFTVRDAHLTRLDGSPALVSIHVALLPDHHAALTLEDLTDLYVAQSELERRIQIDDLTGLLRRPKLRETLVGAPVGSLVAVLDLDQFKEINDAFGHDCGDELLVEVGKLLAEAPEGTLVARFGGDEFGFFCPPGVVTPDDMGRRVSDALSRPLVLPSGLTLQTSASIGITIKTRPDTSADELLRQADVAMYRAKRAHSSFEVYEAADDTSAPHRMMLLGEVRRAIRNHELELHYQPIVDCTSGDIVRLEGLIRWRHPTLGMLPPSDFIELTEMSNLNTDVVLHTLEIAIADVERWSAAGYPTAVSINIAGTTLHDARLMDSIMGRIERASLPRHLLGIELTERQLLLGSGSSVRSLERLANAGVWLSVDDFGTGTSSLAALRHIPAHELKIDKSFVDDLRTGDSALIGSIVNMAHQLGLEVVAEGVEDEVTWRWLRAHGADHAQGYYFARPAPAAAIEPLLAGAPLPWRPNQAARSVDPAG